MYTYIYICIYIYICTYIYIDINSSYILLAMQLIISLRNHSILLHLSMMPVHTLCGFALARTGRQASTGRVHAVHGETHPGSVLDQWDDWP